MSPKQVPARRVPREDHVRRWGQALDRLAAMERELAVGAADPALILAVQAVIAASDALTTFHRGERSSAQGHRDVLELLSRVGELPGLPAARTHLAHVLRKKSDIEYSGRSLPPREVVALAEHARRFVAFVGKHLPPAAR